VRELIVGALHGACGDLDVAHVLQDLGVRMSRDADVHVKDCLVVQALSACLELDAPANRPHIMEALSEVKHIAGTMSYCLLSELLPRTFGA
jgi:hypothetical protein